MAKQQLWCIYSKIILKNFNGMHTKYGKGKWELLPKIEEFTMDRHTNTHTETKSKYFEDTAILLNQKRTNVCEHTTRIASLEFLKSATRGLQEEWMKGNLIGDYLRLMPGLCPSIPLATPWWHLSKTLVMLSLSYAHIHSLSSDWEGRPCLLKYFDFVSVCVFVCLSTVNSSIFVNVSFITLP